MNAELRDVLELLEKATALDVETAEHRDIGLHDCPLCQGEGAVEGTTYTNFDRVAVGVQFFGVGNEHVHLERAVLAAYHFLRKHGEALSRPVVPDGDGDHFRPISTIGAYDGPVIVTDYERASVMHASWVRTLMRAAAEDDETLWATHWMPAARSAAQEK